MWRRAQLLLGLLAALVASMLGCNSGGDAGCPSDPLPGVCGGCDQLCEAGETCVGGLCSSSGSALWVVGRLIIPDRNGNIIDGFNLDGLTTVADDPTGCGLPDFVSPAGEPGIDNLLASLVPALDLLIPIIGPPNVQFVVDDSVADGDVLMGVVVEDAGTEGHINVSMYHLLTASGALPIIENNVLVAGQAFVLDGAPFFTALDVDATSGEILLTPFSTGIRLITSAEIPLSGGILRFNVGENAGEGLVGGAGDPTAIIAEQPIIAPLIQRDSILPGATACEGLSLALYVQAVPGVLQ